MQLEGERQRYTVQGRRTDDHSRCTLVVVEEIGGTLALYPHGWDKWGADRDHGRALAGTGDPRERTMTGLSSGQDLYDFAALRRTSDGGVTQ